MDKMLEIVIKFQLKDTLLIGLVILLFSLAISQYTGLTLKVRSSAERNNRR
jgi:hypothetical protein